MGNEQSNEQRAKFVVHEVKLSPRGVCEHCADPPMFALRILLMVLNEQNDFAQL